jgi:hypothetical protein
LYHFAVLRGEIIHDFPELMHAAQLQVIMDNGIKGCSAAGNYGQWDQRLAIQ